SAAAEARQRVATLLEVRDPAFQKRAGRDAVRREDAGRDSGARAALADRDDSPSVLKLVRELTNEAVGDVAALGDVALVALVLLPHRDDTRCAAGHSGL